MQKLNLPAHPFKLKRIGAHTQIFDEFRKKWLVLTPEEWVRQHLAMHLVSLGYPPELLAIEHTLKLNTMTRRADIVAFNRSGTPFLLAECKAPEVPLTQRTLNQIARYNLVIDVNHLLITNGLNHYCLLRDAERQWRYTDRVPDFQA